ncbi:MAG TPA: tetratricopeptide repeat protein [Vicinamibacterales bacterium]|nr:tetratricopeptide repeat protein [Vicinamibacterales bacterium]
MERSVPLRTGIGQAHDDAGTQSKEAQAFYDQGLAYLHSFVWIEAARSFHEALRHDSKLALAHVGLSYCYVELSKPLEARNAIALAAALAKGRSDHEQRHVNARIQQMQAEDDATRLAAYRKLLDAAIVAFPNDVELVLKRGMAESPDPAERGQGSVLASIPFYERALKIAPNYPAAHHYLAHAYENNARVKEAVDAAAAYASQASSVPHALHMHGHELRRIGRVAEAIARFEAADKVQRDYLAKEKIAPELDWHHAHNLDLLAASYQYIGQMRKAEGLLKQAFNLPTSLLVQAVNKREYPAFLVSRNRLEEAVAAAKTLTAHPHPVVQAAGHIEMGFALLAMNRFAEGANASNLALRALKAAPDGQALAVIPLEALQGEFRLRTAQREQGRQGMERAATKWRSLPGPDAWTQSLFRLEALARAARQVGDWPFAARMAQLMLEHDPNYAGTHYALALVAQHDGNGATAAREFELAVKAWANADKDLPELKQATLRR